MSVVNKMLQYLEARQSQTDEIKADYLPPQKKQSKLLILALLILAIAAIVFALTDINQLFGESNKIASTTNTQPLPSAVTKKMTPVPEKVLQEPIQPQNNSKLSTKAKIELVANSTDIVLASNALSDEQMLPNEHKEATDNLPTLQNIEPQNKTLGKQDNTELNTQEVAEQTSSFSMTGSSKENNSSSLKQQIAESLSDDNLDLARSLLYELLETEADNIKARKKLASLLFSQGNYAQTKQLLTQGIELHPTQSDLRLMLARLYVVQKEPSQAMNILAEFQPNTGSQIEYLAYRAALAQQLKQTKLARSDYQTLANIESTNAKWWLGLAIAEDQLGETIMAVQAYNRASSLGQLDSSVDEIIQQRISVLAGAQ
jgi:MSHA biogenesis protein MshN